MKIMHAYYSEQAAKNFAVYLWEGADQSLVRCTAVYDSVEEAAEDYLWPDAAHVGEVVKYVEKVKEDNYHQNSALAFDMTGHAIRVHRTWEEM